ncbi:MULTISPECIES: phosphate acyltransferase PlsX [unclassified Salinivibrio]|uniref:phosphate acyltransferase PlsX n=1 Tax=unclassified Salinivibrio TaxID=2636825 RepID=UPI00084CAA25|nr:MULTISPECIES: phosphate acyltransferase PlsX [unclassified Salinivibrio]ODP99838.1 phosphate acyltransferase [Salinivibrio sp. DV]OOF09902.1 phosphate acyltransferase [Salinivibrio sp. PR919]OOF15810.1 phosphate acyltransferase [Salinivibrio sp. PR932]
MTGLTIALDAMGGDFGPQVTVPASVQALSRFADLNVILVGDHAQIVAQLTRCDAQNHSRLSIVHAPDVIPNDMRPSTALRRSTGTSMRIALDKVAHGEADACVSAGNTGALMALSKHLLKLLPGVDRPALVTALPGANQQRKWLLDLGANVSCDADTLFQFAVMGAVLAQAELGRMPRIGLLNIGEEEIKGNDLVKRCADMLQSCQAVNYTGYIEGDQIYTGQTDVIVCDGFVGNVALKTSEGVASLVINQVKTHLNQHPIKRWIAKWLFSDLFNQLKQLKPDQYNGASLLGLRGIVVKSHGRADIAAYENAICEAVHEVERQIPTKISDRLEAVLLERH